MSGLCNITAIGNLVADGELKSVQQGSVLSFRMAANVRDGREERTEYFRCSMWGKRGEAVAKFLTKGKRVCVVGSLKSSTREHEGKTYVNLDINVSELVLLGGDEARAQGGPPPARTQTQQPQRKPTAGFDPEDDIPF